MKSFVLLSCLFLAASSANVLIVGGENQDLISELGSLVSDLGHEVTILTHKHHTGERNYTLELYGTHITRSDDGDEILDQIMSTPSSDMIQTVLVKSRYRQSIADLWSVNRAKFLEYIERRGFEVAVVDRSMKLEVATVRPGLQIPLIGLDTSTSLTGLLRSFKTSLSIGQQYSALKEDPHQISDYLVPYDLELLTDHPALSFPFLRPPNTFYLGTGLLARYTPAPLSQGYTGFMSRCTGIFSVVYFSFGDDVIQDLAGFPKFGDMMSALKTLNLCVILKTSTDVAALDFPEGQVMVDAAAPQRDLLHHAKVDLFVSNCGTQDRLEAVFYNTPVLCIPLRGDNLHNARLVKSQGFGSYLLKEELSKFRFFEAVRSVLLDYYDIKERMKTASKLAEDDPTSGTEVLKYFLDVLIQNKNVDYLVNKVITKQRAFEIYNIDILLLGLGSIYVSILLLRATFKVLCGLCRAMKKGKTE